MISPRLELRSSASKLIILYLVFFVAVAVKPSPSRRILFFPLLCLIYSTIFLLPPDKFYPSGVEYQFGLGAAMLLCQASDFVLLNEPQLSVRRNGQKQPVTDLGIYGRLSWATDLISNTRGVNWTFEAPRLRRSTKSRWAFVVSKLKSFAFLYILTDAVTFYMAHNPAFRREGVEKMGAHGFIWQTWNVMVDWTHIYSFMQLNHTLAAAISVAVGCSAPSDWPAWCGPIGDTTTVRKFWGQTWHQSTRRMLSEHGKYLANLLLRIPRGTLASAYVQLFTAFFVSGLVHGAGDFAATRNIHSFQKNILFFVLQAAAITLEDAFISLGRWCGVQRVPKVVGFLWVLIWMGWSSPIWLETLVTGGLIDFRPPNSLFNTVFPGQ